MSDRKYERILKLGPFELLGRRRAPDDPVRRDLEKFRASWKNLRDTVIRELRIDRFVAWLDRKMDRRR